MIDELLEMIKHDFAAKVWPKIEFKGDVVYKFPENYDHRFAEIMGIWQQKKHAIDSTNHSNSAPAKVYTNKSKKALKKEKKKQKQQELQSEEDDNEGDAPESAVTEARDKLRSRMSGS